MSLHILIALYRIMGLTEGFLENRHYLDSKLSLERDLQVLERIRDIAATAIMEDKERTKATP